MRLSTLRRLNAPIVKAYLLKESRRRFWDYPLSAWALATCIANIYPCCAELPLP